jgi:multidrug resistance efflux pump
MNKPARFLFQTVKLSLAIVLIGLSIWALILPPLFPTSIQSLVNAKALTLSAPSQAYVVEVTTTAKAEVTRGSPLLTIQQDIRAMEKELTEREFDLQKYELQLETLKSSIDLRKKDSVIQQELLEENQISYVREFESEMKRAEQNAAYEQKRHEALSERHSKLKKLFEDGIITVSDWDEAKERILESEKAMMDAAEAVSTSRLKLEQAKRGIVESASDQSQSFRQRIESNRQEIQRMEFERIEMQVQRDSLAKQIQTTKSYLEKDHTLDMKSPINGMVFNTYVINGQQVLKGDDLLRIADEKSIFIEATFNRHFLDSITVGDTAHVLLLSEKRFIEGTVIDIQAQEESRSEHNIVQSTTITPGIVSVVIQVPEGTLETRHISQLTKVMITRSEPGMLSKAMVWISFLLRSNS